MKTLQPRIVNAYKPAHLTFRFLVDRQANSLLFLFLSDKNKICS